MSYSDKRVFCDGIVVSPTPYRGGTIYAELVPATPWIVRSHRFPFVQFGRTYPWQRWWFEVVSHEAHHYKYDGGGLTLQRAIWNAMDAVQEAAEAKPNI